MAKVTLSNARTSCVRNPPPSKTLTSALAPTQVREPFHRDGWVYEEKVDGWRMLRAGLLFGNASLTEAEIRTGIRRLADIL